MEEVKIRPVTEKDYELVVGLLQKQWGSTIHVGSKGKVHNIDRQSGFLAFVDYKPVGLLTYHAENNEYEITSLQSFLQHKGVGSQLIAALRKLAEVNKYKRIFLITTNDNIVALRFYQKRGFRIVRIHSDFMDKVRKVKSDVPASGMYEIPLKDGIELELLI
jgi:ribosomal protein S18 acetylase RimI-like enzyme